MTFFRSVRYRIAAWNTLVVALFSAAAILVLHQAMHWALLREIDQVLMEDAEEVQLVVSELSGQGLAAIVDELERKAAGHVQHRWYVELSDATGEPLWSNRDDVTAELSKGTLENTSPVTIGGIRAMVKNVRPNPLQIAKLTIGSSLELFERNMLQIDKVVVGVLGGMFLSAPFLGYWLAGIATRPLEHFTDLADELSPSEMRDRLPVRGVEDEFDRLATTINRLLDRIAVFLEEKRSFLADVAHELRTPLAAIRSSLEITLSEDRSPEEYRELLEQLLEDADSLGILVNQVLLLSEATALEGKPNREKVSLSETVLRSVEMFRGVAESKSIHLNAEIAPQLEIPGVRRHLGQVVNNLLDNAIKYTPSGGTVEVTLTTSADHALLSVSDNGTGISESDLSHIFDRFFRADRARHRDDTHGTGLGLSICQSIVHTHHGRIHCTSRLGEGSSFFVELPLG